MKETKRYNEIMNSFTSFGKERYRKDEILDEMFKLQDELVKLTFNENHATEGDLRIWHVQSHFKKLNEEKGNIADEEVKLFISDAKCLENTIKSEISGIRGESVIRAVLNDLNDTGDIVQNLELCSGEDRCEIDFLYISENALYIIEVKNRRSDIFIDYEGNVYRMGEYNYKEYNILEDMNHKEQVLKAVLANYGYESIPIKRIVVFSNDRVTVRQKCQELTVCFGSQLVDVIEEMDSAEKSTTINVEEVLSALVYEKRADEYAPSFDPEVMKKHFAEMVIKIENAAESLAEEEDKAVDDKKVGIDDKNKPDDIQKKTNFFARVRNNPYVKKVVRYSAIGGGIAAISMGVSWLISSSSNRRVS